MQHINNFHIPYIERLRDEGYTVRVMATGEGADYDIPFVKKILSPRNLISQLKIRKIVKKEGFDAIILNTTLAAFHIRMALPKKKRPKVLNIVHGYLFHEKSGGLKRKILLFCERLLRKKTDAIAVMNEEDLRIATDNLLCAGKVKMTRGMGAKVGELSHDSISVRQYTNTEGKYLITFVGELSERKNQRLLICALPEIKIAIPTAELLLVGAGGEEMRLRALADRLGISDSVHFLGQRRKPCDFILASDLYVSASEIEGMPFNIIEALGVGIPILASDIKGHRELVENGKTGYLYEKGNITELVEKVKAFHTGELTVDAALQREKYLDYSFDPVFNETYALIKDFVI